MYYYVKTVPLNILGENQDTALKNYDSDLYYEFVNKTVSGEVLRARPNNQDILYFLSTSKKRSLMSNNII